MKYRTAVFMTGIVMTLALSACTKPSAAQTEAVTGQEQMELTEISAAYHPGLAALCVPGLGEANGYFAEEGLNVNWVQFTAGPPEIAAMVSGDLQFGYIGHGAHTLCAQGQADVISLSHISNSEQVLVRKSSGIQTMEDLKGKKIVTQLGTSGEAILNLALERAGISKNEVNIYAMDMAGAVSAFIAGQADAIASWDTHSVKIRNTVEEELVVLAQTSDFIDERSFPGSWVATPEYLEENRDVAVRFCRALNKVYQYRAGHMDETIKLSAGFGKLEIEKLQDTRDSAVFYSADDLKKMIEDESIYEIYQSQLTGFIKDKKVDSGDVKDYVRVDIMKEALLTD